ncbi:hypothetical protein [Halorubrum tropicale]|uniref:hypothetical protein n=1 Tax=Halorubrum tropicale TaxID=1765655 RepID=UPI0006B1CEA2|nr:hypothetical protein [Halorubrum tropicale]
MPELQYCEICGDEKPAHLVDRTTVKAIDPLEADICESCQHVHNHRLDEDVCMKCGSEMDSAGFYLELEHPLGAEDLPANRSGTLCGECADWIGTDISYEAIDADEAALQELVRLLDKHHDAQTTDQPDSEEDD